MSQARSEHLVMSHEEQFGIMKYLFPKFSANMTKSLGAVETHCFDSSVS